MAALYTLYHYDDPLAPIRKHVGRRGPAGCSRPARRTGTATRSWRTSSPAWGAASTFDGEDAAAIVASVFAAPGDSVRADPWDGPLVTLRSVPDAVAGLR